MIKKKRSKYKNTRVKNSYGSFDSIGEFKRFLYLTDLEREGKISNLKRQIKFPLTVGTEHICDYRADFTYDRDGKPVVEDYKGFETDVFKIKMKLMKAVHKIHILITKSPTA